MSSHPSSEWDVVGTVRGYEACGRTCTIIAQVVIWVLVSGCVHESHRSVARKDLKAVSRRRSGSMLDDEKAPQRKAQGPSTPVGGDETLFHSMFHTGLD